MPSASCCVPTHERVSLKAAITVWMFVFVLRACVWSVVMVSFVVFFCSGQFLFSLCCQSAALQPPLVASEADPGSVFSDYLYISVSIHLSAWCLSNPTLMNAAMPAGGHQINQCVWRCTYSTKHTLMYSRELVIIMLHQWQSLLGECEATHTHVSFRQKKMNAIHLCIFSSHSPSFSGGKYIQPLSHFHSLFLGLSPESHHHLLLESEGTGSVQMEMRRGRKTKTGNMKADYE